MYNLPTAFKPDNTTSTFSNFMVGKTFCFGSGRGDMKGRVLNPKNLGADKASPGPAMYMPIHPIGTYAKKISFKSKLSYGDPEHMAKMRNIPGPGTHEDKSQFNENGNYFPSEMQNSKA